MDLKERVRVSVSRALRAFRSLFPFSEFSRFVSMKTESRKALLWPTPDWNFPWSRRGVDLRKIEIR